MRCTQVDEAGRGTTHRTLADVVVRVARRRAHVRRRARPRRGRRRPAARGDAREGTRGGSDVSDRTVVELRHGAYHDSVTLLQVSRTLAAVDGVHAAQVAMGTELNLDVLRTMGFDVPRAQGPTTWCSRCGQPTTTRSTRARAGARRRAAPVRGGTGRGLGRTGTRPHGRRGRPPDAGRQPRPGLGARPARLHRGDGRAGIRAVGAAVQRQRLRRGGGAAQGRGRAGAGCS